MRHNSLGAVFFDIGNTLGTVDFSPLKLTPFPSTIPLLKAFRDALGLPLGVITNVGDIPPADIRQMLKTAGFLEYFSPNLIVTSDDVHGDKPHAPIYAYAAAQAHLPPQRCLYIGEDPVEVQGAMTAGMAGILKPIPN